MGAFGVFGFRGEEMIEIYDLPNISTAENIAELIRETTGADVVATGIAYSRVNYGVCAYCELDGDETIKPLPFYRPDLEPHYPYATQGCGKHADEMSESLFCYVNDC